MNNKKKRLIIITIMAIILLLIVIIIFSLNNKNRKEEKIQTVELSELIDIENIDELPYKTKKTKEEISSKYTSSNKYEPEVKVKAEEQEGKMIYIRSSYENLNIYKTEYEIGKYSEKSIRTNEIIQNFEEICKGYMNQAEEYEESEYLYGESKEDVKIPIEESIYYENRLYSKTYKNEENEYDINYYKKDEKIICEFVKVLE